MNFEEAKEKYGELVKVIPISWIEKISHIEKVYNLECKKDEVGNFCISFNVDNRCGEDHYEEFEIDSSLDAEDRQLKFRDCISDIYEEYDVDEQVEMYLAAKRNGLKGVPSASDLAENCKEIDEVLKEFSDKVNYALEIDGDFEPEDLKGKEHE